MSRQGPSVNCRRIALAVVASVAVSACAVKRAEVPVPVEVGAEEPPGAAHHHLVVAGRAAQGEAEGDEEGNAVEIAEKVKKEVPNLHHRVTI